MLLARSENEGKEIKLKASYSPREDARRSRSLSMSILAPRLVSPNIAAGGTIIAIKKLERLV